MIICLGIMLEILHMIYKFNDTHVPYRQYDIVYIPYYTYFILQMLQIRDGHSGRVFGLWAPGSGSKSSGRSGSGLRVIGLGFPGQPDISPIFFRTLIYGQ